eukprot:898615-Pleurochrysis_carterae.AAC.1
MSFSARAIADNTSVCGMFFSGAVVIVQAKAGRLMLDSLQNPFSEESRLMNSACTRLIQATTRLAPQLWPRALSLRV